jgi:hypothetical protein
MNEENMSIEEVNAAIDEGIEICAEAEESFPVYNGIMHKLLSVCPIITMILAVLISRLGTPGLETELKSWGLLLSALLIWAVCNVINLFYYVKNSLETYELIALKEEMLNESKDSI